MQGPLLPWALPGPGEGAQSRSLVSVLMVLCTSIRCLAPGQSLARTQAEAGPGCLGHSRWPPPGKVREMHSGPRQNVSGTARADLGGGVQTAGRGSPVSHSTRLPRRVSHGAERKCQNPGATAARGLGQGAENLHPFTQEGLQWPMIPRRGHCRRRGRSTQGGQVGRHRP